MSTETSVQQFALEFGPSKVQADPSAPPGTWTVCPRFSTAEYRAAIARAQSALPAQEPFLQMLYREGVALASGALRELDETIEDEAACRYALPRLELPVNADVFRHFIALCDSEATPGAEHRTRTGYGWLRSGLYLTGLGGLIGACWKVGGFGIDYTPYRDTFFQPSFRDAMPRFQVPASTWEASYAALIGNAVNAPASVRTFTYAQRRYVNTGGLSHGAYRECIAWSVVAHADWPGATYTTGELRRAWDDGCIERGNERGLRVRVNQQPCVLDSPALFFDHASPASAGEIADDSGQIDLVVYLDSRRWLIGCRAFGRRPG